MLCTSCTSDFCHVLEIILIGYLMATSINVSSHKDLLAGIWWKDLIIHSFGRDKQMQSTERLV